MRTKTIIKRAIALTSAFTVMLTSIAGDVSFAGYNTGKVTAQAEENALQVTETKNAGTFSWKNATEYSIIIDRFKNGNKDNDHSYGRKNDKAETGDDRATFHGGDFVGITQEIENGYFDALGVNVLVLSTPFEQEKGHISDTRADGGYIEYAYDGSHVADYTKLDANYGTEEEFSRLINAAHLRGIKIVLEINAKEAVAAGEDVYKWIKTHGIDGFNINGYEEIESETLKKWTENCKASFKEWKKSAGASSNDLEFNISRTEIEDEENITGNLTLQKYNEEKPENNIDTVTGFSSKDTKLTRGDMITLGSSLLMMPEAVKIFYGDETDRAYALYETPDADGSITHALRSDMNLYDADEKTLTHWQKLGTFRKNHIAIGAGKNVDTSVSSGIGFVRLYEEKGVTDRVVVVTGAEKNEKVTVDVSKAFADGEKVINYYDDTEAKVKNGSVTFDSGDNGTILIGDILPKSQEELAGASAPSTTKIHVKLSDGNAPYVYAWSNDSAQTTLLGGWPGTLLTTKDSNGYYVTEVNTTAAYNMIVNGGSGKWQTADISNQNGEVWYTVDVSTKKYTKDTVEEEKKEEEEEEEEKDKPVLHVKTSNGSAPNIYAWVYNGTSTPIIGGWPGATLSTKDADGYYTVQLNTTGTYNMIVNGSWGQTADMLDLNGNLWVSVDTNTGKCQIDTKKFEEEEEGDYTLHVMTSDNSIPYVYGWTYDGTSKPILGGWPGKMLNEKDSDGYYCTKINAADAYNIIVNGGSGKWQSVDMSNLKGNMWIKIDTKTLKYELSDKKFEEETTTKEETTKETTTQETTTKEETTKEETTKETTTKEETTKEETTKETTTKEETTKEETTKETTTKEETTQEETTQEEDKGKKKIHVKTSDGSMPYVYGWTWDGSVHMIFGDWPGAPLSKKGKDGYYYVCIDTEDNYSIIVNGGPGKWQTADISNLKGEVWIDVNVNTLEATIVESKYETLKREIRIIRGMASTDYTDATWNKLYGYLLRAEQIINDGEDSMDVSEAIELLDKIEEAKNRLVLVPPTVTKIGKDKTIRGNAPYGSMVYITHNGNTYSTRVDDSNGTYTYTLNSLKSGDTIYLQAKKDGKESAIAEHVYEDEYAEILLDKSIIHIRKNTYYSMDIDLRTNIPGELEVNCISFDEDVANAYVANIGDSYNIGIHSENTGVSKITIMTPDSTATAELTVVVVDENSIVKSGEYEYIVNPDGDSVTITAYKGHSSELIIPSYIDGKKVTKIGIDNNYSYCYDGGNRLYYYDELCSVITKLSKVLPEEENSIVYEDWTDKNFVTKITFPDTLEAIGDNSFFGERKLTTLDFSKCKNLTVVGQGAFKDCEGLKDVDMKQCTKLNCICKEAFYNCISLKNIEFPSSLRKMEYGIFSYCKMLESINFNDLCNLEYMSSISYGCELLKEVDLSNTKITEMGGFGEFLEKIKLPPLLREIGAGTFACCENLKSVDFSNLYNLEYIGPESFYRCEKLEGLDLSDCTRLREISWHAFLECCSIDKLVLPTSIKCIGDQAFGGCYEISSVNFKDLTNLELIIGAAFVGCKKIKEVDLSGTLNLRFEETYISKGGCFAGFEAMEICKLPVTMEEIPSCFLAGCSKLKDININEMKGLKKIGYGAFDGCEKLTCEKINFAKLKKLEEIEDAAFRGCNGFDKVDLSKNDKLVTIWDRAFEGCKNVKTIKLPDNIKEIRQSAFADTGITELTLTKTIADAIGENGNVFGKSYYLKNLTIEDGVTAIPNGTFEHCISLEEITFPDSVKSIGDSAFSFNVMLKNVTLPKNLTYLGECAFFANYSLEEMYIPDGVERVNAFRDCYNLKKLYGGKNVKYFAPFAGYPGWGADAGGTYLTFEAQELISEELLEMYNYNTFDDVHYITDELTITGFENVEVIGDNAFNHVKNPECYKLPDTVREIGKCAYAGTCIEEFVAPKNLKVIGENAFSSSTLKKITLNEGLETVKLYAFAFTCIEEITFPESVTSIEQRCFADCLNLKHISIKNFNCNISEYMLTYAYDWKTYAGKYGSNPPKRATQKVYIHGEYGSTAEIYANTCPDRSRCIFVGHNTYIAGDYVYTLQNGEAIIREYTGSATELTVPAVLDGYNVRKIADNVFSQNYRLTKVVLEAGIRELGDTVFSGCNNLSEITIPESVEKIGNGVFEAAGGYRYSGEVKIKKLIINCYRDTVAMQYAINNRINFRLLDGIDSDYDISFDVNGNIVINKYLGSEETVFIPSEIYGVPVETIGKEAFIGNENVNKVYMPDAVKTVLEGAFKNCTNLTYISISQNLSKISNEMFNGCTALAYVQIPYNVTGIGWKAFYNCKALQIESLHENITGLGSYVFSGCESIESIEFLGSVDIPCGAFANCTNLKNIIWPEDITEVGSNAFENTGFVTMTFPYGVTKIGGCVLENAKNLKEVFLPQTLRLLPEDYDNLWNQYGTSDIEGIKKYVNDHYTRGTNFGKKDNRNKVTVYYPKSVKKVLDGKVEFKLFDTFTYEYEYSYTTDSGYKFVEMEDNFSYRAVEGYGGRTELYISKVVTDTESVKIPDNYAGYDIVGIDANAFEGNRKLKTVEISSRVYEIGDECFKDCSSLKTVIVGTFGKKKGDEFLILGSNLFTGCTSMKTFVVNGDVVQAEENFLGGQNSIMVMSRPYTVLDNIEIAKHVTYGDDTPIIAEDGLTYSFRDDSSLSVMGYTGTADTVTIPKQYLGVTVKEIAKNAFKDKTNVKEVVIPRGIEKINHFAFMNSGIRTINIPDTVTDIGAGVVAGCKSLTEIKVNSANKEYVAVDGVMFRKDMTEIMAYPAGRTDATYAIPQSVQELCPYVFSGAKYLEEIIYPEGMYYKDNTTTADAEKEIGEYIAPEAPIIIGAVSLAADKMNVTWFPEILADGYIVYRKPVDGSWEEIARVDGTVTEDTEYFSYTDENVIPGKEYCYTVRGYVTTTTNGKTVEGSFDPDGVKGTTVPEILVLEKVIIPAGTRKRQVYWKKVTGSKGYFIYRRASKDDEWMMIKKIEGEDTLMYEDVTDDDKNYYYTVQAYTENEDGVMVRGYYDEDGITVE